MSEHVASRRASKLHQVIVARKLMETEDIAAFHLSGLDAEALPPFTAGAHIDVHLTPGLIRQYSLCNAPGEQDNYVIAVKREAASRGGSKSAASFRSAAPATTSLSSTKASIVCWLLVESASLPS